MHRVSQRAALAAVVFTAFTLAAAAAQARTIDIATARHLPLGTTVTVEGSVTAPSGDFASSFFDEGFAIQDRTGGIYVSTVDNLGVAFRQEARVTGQLADSGGLLILVPAHDSDVRVHGLGDRVFPLWVRTGAVGEATEGLIVQVFGRITRLEDDAPFGQKVFVNDGSGEIRVFINTGTGISVAGVAPGQLLSVTGFSGQFNDYEIDPRFPSDLRQPAH